MLYTSRYRPEFHTGLKGDPDTEFNDGPVITEQEYVDMKTRILSMENEARELLLYRRGIYDFPVDFELAEDEPIPEDPSRAVGFDPLSDVSDIMRGIAKRAKAKRARESAKAALQAKKAEKVSEPEVDVNQGLPGGSEDDSVAEPPF